MLHKRTFRYRMYPSKTTESKMLETLEVCRQTYNELLGICIETYQHMGKGLTKFDMNNCMRYLDTDIDGIHSQVLQNVSDRIDKAFKHFFRRLKEKQQGKRVKVGYPRFKKKGNVKSFTYPQSGYNLDNHILKLSKIGMLNLRIGRKQNKVKGNIKTLTIKRMPSGKWFATFSCEVDVKPRKHPFPNRKIGIDVGLENFATLSNGTVIENHRFLVKSERKLKTLNRRLGRKKKASNRRGKAKIKLARMHEHISNQRYDFIHKTTRMLVNKFGYMAVEDLNIKNMVRHPYLAKHINDASWAYFVRILGYKAESAGGRVVKVNPRRTSQICNQCGAKVPKTLATRWHRCPVCGLHTGRDLNSARKILKDSTIAGTAGSYADGDRSSPLGGTLEDSLSKKSEATQLVGW